MSDPFNPRLKIRTDYLAAIIVTLAPIFYFLPALIEGLVVSPDDGMLQNIPFRVVAAHILGTGQLPIWNPYVFSGMPLLGAAQGGLLFPLNWFYLLFAAPLATNLMVISTFMVAGLGAFLFARKTGASVVGAVVTSLIWQSGGFLINQVSHINIIQTAALLPWVLWAIERYVETGSRRRAAILAALIALQIFAGHQQAFAYTSLVVGAYAIVMSIGNQLQRKRYLLSLVFGSLGVLLAAVQVLPTWELLQNSLRSTASYDFFTSFSMPKHFVMTFLAPYLMGGGDGRLFRAPYIGQSFYTEYVPYAGILAIMFGLLALMLKPDRRTKFWAVVVVFGLLMAFGRFAPLSFNRLVYFVPILNLFRVPARHLMEVHFAVAILAGRGLTSLLRDDARKTRYVLIVAVTVFVLTCLVVTVGRPLEFHLSREAPVTLIRAPELFMPIVFAGVSAITLWLVALRRRGSVALLFVVLGMDLFLWGQFGGWYTSSRRIPNEYWSVPESVQLLRNKTEVAPGKARIYTTHLPFDPAVPVPADDRGWVLWTEPDIYMMHGIENAAGYDGFGLQRYSELAGQMKLWGALADPNASLRSNSRELDLLNVRYVVSRHERPVKRDDSEDEAAPNPVDFDVAREKYGEYMFAQTDLSLPNLGPNKRLTFGFPAVETDHVALLTNLSFAEDVPDNTIVAYLRLRAIDGREFEFPLRAGIDTADWAYDRADIRKRIRHKRAEVATSYDVRDVNNTYKAHTYLTSFVLPERVQIESGDVRAASQDESHGALLTLFRISLADVSAGRTYPLTRNMITVENTSAAQATAERDQRWKLVGRGLDVNIYENARALPRAWLATEYRVMEERSILQVVRTGVLPDGSPWDPLRTALIEIAPQTGLKNVASERHLEMTTYAANSVRLRSRANGDSFLVLSDNDYPGWRAYIDGQSTPIVRTNYALRGVVVPGGEHEIVFTYRPWSVLAGLLVSALTAVGLVVFCLIGKKVSTTSSVARELRRHSMVCY